MTRLDELLAAFDEDTLDAAGQTELRSLLEQPECRSALVRHYHTSAVISQVAQDPVKTRDKASPLPFWRRWRFTLAASVALIVIAATFAAFFNPPVVIASLSNMEGRVLIDSMPAENGTPVRSGATLEAADSAARVRINFTDGSWTRLEGKGRAMLAETKSGLTVHLEQGALLAEIKKQKPGRTFNLSTPRAVATVIGTRFRLSDDGQRSRLEVEEGKVGFGSKAESGSVVVSTGTFADVAAGSVLAVRPLQDLEFEPAARIVADTQPLPGLRTLDLGDGVKLELVLIRPGVFQMGIPGDARDEMPRPRVRLSPYYIGAFEVTQEQYQQVMGKNPSRTKAPRNPVEMVTWHDAVEFCRKASALSGLAVRLPTEAQWEYACRAGTSTFYSFGNDSEELNDHAWTTSNTVNETPQAVGLLKPNPWGLYDMHGNVSEWCADWYGPYSAGPATDPQGPVSGDQRVTRGGSVHSAVSGSYRRWPRPPQTRQAIYGFRVVVRVDKAPAGSPTGDTP